jgi:hypothetical protein
MQLTTGLLLSDQTQAAFLVERVARRTTGYLLCNAFVISTFDELGPTRAM